MDRLAGTRLHVPGFGRKENALQQPNLFLDITIVLLAAFAGGAIAHKLRQPPIVGYLAGGIVIGPYGIGLIKETQQVQILAEIGVVLLMFALGVEFSLENLKPVQNIALFGASLQVLAMVSIGAAIALSFAWPLATALYFGCIVALSSTMIVLKTLMDRGELDSLQGRIMIGFLIVQDLSVVPMIVILPTVANQSQDILSLLTFAVIKAIAVLFVVLQLGTRFVPWFMAKVSEMQSRELFLLSVVALSLGAALAAFLLGLSLALGAFVAGLTLSKSEYSVEILADLVPLRDTFSILFFSSIGMLLDPRFVIGNFGPVIMMIGLIVAGKFLISALITGFFGYPPKTAVMVGLGLTQIGEFSFVLARQGVELGAIPDFLYSLTLTAAIATIILTPFAFRIATPTYNILCSIPLVREFMACQGEEHLVIKPERLANHVVICGYGRVSRGLVQLLERRGFTSMIIEINPHVVADARKRGLPCIYGDASNRGVLNHTDLQRARVLVVTVPDPIATELIIRHAREINPRLDIVVRATLGASLEFLRHLGATEVVEPEFEAGLEIIRHTLSRLGISGTEAQFIVNSMRAEHYTCEDQH